MGAAARGQGWGGVAAGASLLAVLVSTSASALELPTSELPPSAASAVEEDVTTGTIQTTPRRPDPSVLFPRPPEAGGTRRDGAPVQRRDRTAPRPDRPLSYALRHASGGVEVVLAPGGTLDPSLSRRPIAIPSIEISTVPASLPLHHRARLAVHGGPASSAYEVFQRAALVQAAVDAWHGGALRVVAPAQILLPGRPATLSLVEQRVLSLDLSQAPDRLRPLIERRIAAAGGLAAGPILLRETLQLLFDQLRLPVELTLRQAPAGVVLAVSAKDRLLSAEAWASGSTSSVATGAGGGIGVVTHGALGFGERVYATIIPAERREFDIFRGPSVSGVVGVTMPVWGDRTTLDLSYTHQWDRRRVPIEPVPGFGDMGIFALDTHRWSARLAHAIIQSADFRLSARLGLDVMHQSNGWTNLGVPLWSDRTRVVRIGLEGSYAATSWLVLTGSLEFSQGLGGLGARGVPGGSGWAVPLSREGAGPEFSKLDARLRAAMTFEEVWSLEIAGRATTSFGRPLLFSEQAAILMDAPLARLNAETPFGDDSLNLRADFGRRFDVAGPFGAGATLFPYLFGAVGLAVLHRPMAGEIARVRGEAFGAGLRYDWRATSSVLAGGASIEIGRYTTSSPLIPDHTRVMGHVTLRY